MAQSGLSRPSPVWHMRDSQTWVTGTPIAELVAWRVGEVLPLLKEVESQLTRGRVAVGWLAYESAPAFDRALHVMEDPEFPAAAFLLFEQVKGVDLPVPAGTAPPTLWKPEMDLASYQARFAQVKRWLESGDTYQVNATFRLRASLDFDPWQLFWQMTQRQPCGYGGFLPIGGWTVASASPELFLVLEGNRLRSKPMKGTAPRGPDPVKDDQEAKRLQECPKNRAENLMIVDMVRSDLGRVAKTGTVQVPKLFQVEPLPTVWQMTSTVEAHTDAGLVEVLSALFPAASITGAPKVRTTQLIKELETSSRRAYTGSLAVLEPGRRWQLSVAIRTLLCDHKSGKAEYGVGSGLVWDSVCEDEYSECLLKARVLGGSIAI